MAIQIPTLKKVPPPEAAVQAPELAQAIPELPQEARPVARKPRKLAKFSFEDSRPTGKRDDRSALKRLSMEISPETHKKLKLEALNHETTISAIVLSILHENGF